MKSYKQPKIIENFDKSFLERNYPNLLKKNLKTCILIINAYRNEVVITLLTKKNAKIRQDEIYQNFQKYT